VFSLPCGQKISNLRGGTTKEFLLARKVRVGVHWLGVIVELNCCTERARFVSGSGGEGSPFFEEGVKTCFGRVRLSRVVETLKAL